jgi:hypothetical protein
MSRFLKILLFLAVFGFVIYWINYQSDRNFNKEMDEICLKGKIINKIIDKTDHNIPKIIIGDKKDSLIFDLANESSGLFDFVQVGDSILKIKNDRKVRIFNDEKDSIFILAF